MKKLFLGLIATVMFCFAGNAQTKKEAISKLYKVSMVSLVDNARPFYKEGMSYSAFLDVVANKVNLTKEENIVATDIYNFLVKKTDVGLIYQNYDGGSLRALLNTPNTQLTPAARCGFLCWLITIRDLLNTVIEALGGE